MAAPPQLVIPTGQPTNVLQFFRAVAARLESLQATGTDRAVTVSELVDLKLVNASRDGALTLGANAKPQTLDGLMDPATMEEYYKIEEVRGDHELLLYDWREKRFRRLDFALLGTIEWATCAEADAGTVEKKAIDPKVGACSYDRKRVYGQHEAGKGTKTVALTISAGAVTANCQLSNVFRLVLTSSPVTFNNPINPLLGQTVNVTIKQDATGGRTLTFGTKVKVTGSIDTGANKASILSMQYDETDDLWRGVISKGFA